MTVLLDTADLGEAEHLVSANYTKVCFTPSDDAVPRVHVERTELGSMVLDDFQYGMNFTFDGRPLDDIVLCLVRSGMILHTTSAPEPHLSRAGDIIALGAHEGQHLSGEARGVHFDAISLDRRVLDTVAAGVTGSEPVRLTAPTPVSPIAGAHVITALRHIKHSVATNPCAAQSPLVVANARQYLAACVLAAFPTTAHLEPTAADRHDSTPTLLRRAIAYIDSNAQRDISMVDIANAVYVTPRALQYMFRKHCHCTPTEYLRRVRLSHAHAELAAGDRSTTRVAEIALRWGFSHSGRFAVYYREQYGESPHATLRR
ncbi:helix-turn-helix transcriptional regulator [Mycobacterium sp. PSTR-4-N]|uniref:helix-turn-helix transcriptional regulator n=1 Tax=Mycobacterium sp. PSTR-4-N TaxID=2917745 RepID=UPI001F14DECA|nr:helix-turn-helix transcriptional regulator [Mycobacterium sp. PSTR-4-N]MCG7597671.1 helix-turn-helix transcriptional regulator [Mycobacterium sp. PSTR-4-N]